MSITGTKSTGVVLVFFALILIVAGYFAWQSYTNHGAYKEETDIGRSLNEKTAVYTDSEGNVIDLSVYKGKPLVVNLWASWTPFSADELPYLSELSKQYEGRLNVLAINRSEPIPRAESFVRKLNVDENLIFLFDVDDVFYNSVGGYAMPETIFYDSDGNIVFHKRGNMTREELFQRSEGLISE